MYGIFFAAFLAPLSAQSDAEKAQAAANTGEQALRARQFEKAEEEFRQALSLDPSNAQARIDLGTLQWMRGNCGEARTNLREALRREPSRLGVQAMLGICEKRLGDKAAELDLKEAFSKSTDTKLQLETGVELGDLYFERGDLDRALPVVRALVALAPENPDILYFALQIYQQMADETLNKLALVAPASARMQQVIAERLVNAGDLKNAAAHYRDAIRIDPALPGAHFELAESLIEASPHDKEAQAEGLKELQTGLHIDGESSRLECEIARVAYLQGQIDLALSHYERAYALNPKEVEAQLGAGRILLMQSNAERALHYLEEAAAQDPLNAQAHYELARALKACHRDEDAQRETKVFETVRNAQATVRDLYMQMNKHISGSAEPLPTEEMDKP